MSIATELTKLEQNRANIVSAVNDKGGTLADNAPLSAVPSAIASLPSGGIVYAKDYGLKFAFSGWESIPDEINLDGCTSYADMFNKCTQLTELPPIDASTATNFYSMCYMCGALANVQDLNAVNAANLDYMFYGCSSLNSIQLKIGNVIGDDMFNGCTALMHVYIEGIGGTLRLYAPNVTAESVAYMINHAGEKSTTIKLHSDAYERALSDDAVTAALKERKNVTLASY